MVDLKKYSVLKRGWVNTYILLFNEVPVVQWLSS